MYPESYIQKSSGACPGFDNWIAKQWFKMIRHRCGPPGDFVPILKFVISLI